MSNERKQQASLAMVILLEERNQAIQQFQEESQRRIKQNQFSEALLRCVVTCREISTVNASPHFYPTGVLNSYLYFGLRGP